MTPLGPRGLGPLTLGMTAAQARATGVLRTFDDPSGSPGNPGGCAFVQPVASTDAQQGAVVFSSDLGLVAINAYGDIATPEGVKIGDPYAKVHAAYPKWAAQASDNPRVGHGFVPVPGNSAAVYRIDVGQDGKVRALTLQLGNEDCYE